MECFTADIFRFFTEKHRYFALVQPTGYAPLNRMISLILLKFPNFLRSQVLNRSETSEATHTSISGNNNLVSSLSLMIKRNCAKKRIYKCFVQDCLKIFFLGFTSLKIIILKMISFQQKKVKALLQLELRLVPSSQLTRKYKIVVF